MQRVLLSCKSPNDARYLKNYFEAELPYEINMAWNAKEIDQMLKQKKYNLILLQTGNLMGEDIRYAQQLREKGYSNTILMITNSVGNLNIEQLHERFRIYFLERPFELKTLKGLVRKLMVSKTVPQQVYRRFKTNLTATLEAFISGHRFQTNMFNLSKGGAYFELAERPQVSVGDLLRLRVRLNDMDREHSMHGRIIWTTHKGHAAGGYGLGVQFMKSSDIYRNLLEKL